MHQLQVECPESDKKLEPTLSEYSKNSILHDVCKRLETKSERDETKY